MDSEEQKIEEAVNNAYEDLSEEEKQELKDLGEKLEEIAQPNRESSRPIENKEIKNRIAKICLELIEKTPKYKENMAKTSHIIAGNLVWYDYWDSLDGAVEIAGELEVPEHASKNIFEMFEEMKKKFEICLR